MSHTYDELHEIQHELVERIGAEKVRTIDLDFDFDGLSDGDRLRLLALRECVSRHMAFHIGVPIEMTTIRELLRIAARLDIADQETVT